VSAGADRDAEGASACELDAGDDVGDGGGEEDCGVVSLPSLCEEDFEK